MMARNQNAVDALKEEKQQALDRKARQRVS